MRALRSVRLPGGRTAIKLIVSVVLLLGLFRKVGVHKLATTLSSASPSWVALALGFGLLATAAQTTQWRQLVMAFGMHPSWPRCLRLTFVGYTFNTVLPSAIGGDVMRALLVSEKPEQRVDAAASVVLQRLCNFPGMIVVMLGGLLLTLHDGNASRIRPVALAGSAVGIAGMVVWTSPLMGRIGRTRAAGKLRLGKLLAVLDGFRGQRDVLLRGVGRGFVFWSFSVLNQWAFMRALGININIVYAALVVTVVNAITMLPISVNGYGVRDGALVAFLAVGGIATQSMALAASLFIAGQTLLWGLAGLACWVTLPQRKQQRETTPSSVDSAESTLVRSAA